MHVPALHLISLFLALACSLWAAVPGRAEPQSGAERPGPDVLVLQSYHRGYSWTDNIQAGIDSVFGRVDGLVVKVEYMDTKNTPLETVAPTLAELLRTKYAAQRPKVVITADNNALEFMVGYRETLFPGVPVVFCGVNNFNDHMLLGMSGYTGVVEAVDMVGSIRLALALHPRARYLAAVSDVTQTGRINRIQFEAAARRFRNQVSLIDLAEMRVGELAEALDGLPPEAIVFNLNFFRDPDGQTFTVAQANRIIRDHTGLPVYTLWDFDLGQGAIGGLVVSGEAQGEAAALMAQRILAGVPVAEIPILRESPNRCMFDYNTLSAAGLKVEDLPEESVVVNRVGSFYELYAEQLKVAALLVAVIAVSMTVMGVSIVRRRQAQRELQSLFDNSQAGIVHLKGGRRIYRVNRRLAEMLGYGDPEKLIGFDVRDFHMDEQHYEEFGNKYYSRLVSKKRINAEYPLRKINGEPVWVMLSGMALDPAPTADLSKGVVWVVQDISERKAAEDKLAALNRELEDKVADRTRDLVARTVELEAANRQLRRLDQVKSAFLNTVSHDLRTPLTSIRGFVRLIHRDFESTFAGRPGLEERDRKVGDRILSNLTILEEEGERLTRLINDFLDLSKMESGNMVWRDRVLDLGETVARAAEMCKGNYETKPDLKLVTEVEDGLAPVMADEDRILQVVVNLLNNAIKYTDKGVVTVRARSDGGGGNVVEVQDTGIGIPDEEQALIFDKFHQVETGDTLYDSAKGTGLGLAICQEIVHHYNGSIWVRSVPGQGSVFGFSLPGM